MMQINGTVPANMAVDEVAVSSGVSKTIAHSLGKVPDAIVIFPKVQPTGTGIINSYMIYGSKLGGGGYNNKPYKLVSNAQNATGNWDYAGTNQGWDADANNVYLEFINSDRMSAGNYVLITYCYD